MAILNLQNLTLNPQEVTDFKQIVMKASMENPALRSMHNVMEGVTMKEQIVLADKLGLSGLKSDGCERQAATSTSTFSQKYWEPVGIESTWSICQAEINGLFKAYYSKIDSFKQMYNIEGSDEAMFVAQLISKAAYETILRAVWFGDTDVAAADSDSEGLIDGNNTVYFDYFDGIFKQIKAGVSAGTITKVSLSGITTPTVSASEAYSAMMNVYKSAKGALRSNPDAKFYVTGQMFLGLIEYLQTESVNFTIDYTLEGFERIKFLGKDVINMEGAWDDTIAMFVEDTTDNKVLNPHRIVFTTPSNIPVATTSVKDFDEIEVWYNQDERTNKMAIGFTLDAKVLDEEMIVIAE